MKLQGTITALITPFHDGDLDEEGLIQNIDFQIAQGIDGMLVLGSTGESPTISPAEQKRIIKLAVERSQKKALIWVGTGTYCTQITIENTKQAKDLGADVALIVTPYYSKPTQEGIYRHFEIIASEVDIPIVVYNIQGRTGVNIETTTLKRLADISNIIGVKEASGNLNQAGDVLHTIKLKRPDFCVFSGDDVFTLPMMALGADGAISVVSNLVPAAVIAQVNAALDGDFALARQMHHALLPLYKAAFVETNPIPIKAAMQLCGMPAGDCRLPLSTMAPHNLDMLKELLNRMQLVNA